MWRIGDWVAYADDGGLRSPNRPAIEPSYTAPAALTALLGPVHPHAGAWHDRRDPAGQQNTVVLNQIGDDGRHRASVAHLAYGQLRSPHCSRAQEARRHRAHETPQHD